MATIYKSTQVEFASATTSTLITATAQTIVTSVRLDEYTGAVTLKLKKGASSAVSFLKASANGELLDAPLTLEAGDYLQCTTTASGPILTSSYAYSSEDPSGQSIGVLIDVDITDIADGEVLVWNETAGEFRPGAGGGGSGVTSVNGDTGPAVDLDATDIFYQAGTTVFSKISSNSTNISSNSSAIAANLAAIQANDVDISDLETLTNNHTTQIAAAQSDIATNVTDIATNANDIATLDTTVSNHTTLISANASDISNLENGVGNVTSLIATNTITGDITFLGTGNVTVSDNGSGTITINGSGGGGGGSDSFNTITVPTQSDVVAASGNDTLNFVDGDGISMTTNNTTKTITFDVDGLGNTTLAHDRLWLGDANGVPQETQRIGVANLPTLTNGNIWIGDGSNLPSEAAATSLDGLWNQSGNNLYHNAGNVGIGTTSPSEKLHVAGDVKVDSDLHVDGDTYGIYHRVVNGKYYFDTYQGDRNVNAFLKTSRSDIIKYQDIGVIEYWNGTSWVDATSTLLPNLKKLLDGRQDTKWDIGSAYYKFRFTVTASTSWPTMALIGAQTSWTASTYPGYTMTVEEQQTDSSWATEVTADFTSTNGVSNWGTAFIASIGLHTGRGHQPYSTRITIDFDGWTPSVPSSPYIPLQNIFIYSNFSGTEVNDYQNLLDYSRLITAPNGILLDSGDLRVRGAGQTDTVIINGDGDSYFNGGNVGIGITTPQENLHVFSSDAPAALFQSDVPYALISFMDEATTNASTVSIGAEENDLLFKAGSSFSMALTDAGKLGVGTTTPTQQLTLTQNAEIGGYVDAKHYLFDYNDDAGTTSYRGETINLGTTATTAGRLYAWNGTNWIEADADLENTASAMLGIATGNNSDKGMLISGYYKLSSSYSAGQLYMSATAGQVTSTPPSTTGQSIRVIGHGMGGNIIRFNPSNDYFTVE